MTNDDYERQARNTTSSLEDMEYKYNAAIERGVLLEEEIKNGDQEREQLRIENQRLRDELSDVKIETEIVQEKLRNAESNGRRNRKPTSLYRSPSSTPQTPEIFDRSPGTSTISSPIFTTPPAKGSLASVTATPPSPPISESSSSMRKSINATPGFPRQKASGGDLSSLSSSRSLHASRSTQRFAHARATSMAYPNGRSVTPSLRSNHTAHNSISSVNGNSNGNGNGNGTHGTNGKGAATAIGGQRSGLPKSGSLCQIRGLIGKMQKLEERVQSAKSKLPPPSDSPSRGSSRAVSRAGSRTGSGTGDSPMTARRDPHKRQSGDSSSFSSSVRDGEGLPSYLPQSRGTFSSTRTPGDSRPSSRTSFSSSISYGTHPSVAPSSTRPESRQSRTRTPLGHYSVNPMTEGRRPRSSLSGSVAGNGGSMSHITEDDDDLANDMSMRATISGFRGSRLPSAAASASTSGSASASTSAGWKKRNISSGIPAPRSLKINAVDGSPSKMADLGETY